MATYWIDPFLEANIQGIHGTLNTTTRNGTYEYPFSILDFVQTNSTQQTSVNGVTFTSGDQIRIKGQALTDYFFNIGSPDKWQKVTGFSSSDMYLDNTYTAGLNSYRASINNTPTSNNGSGVYVYYDPDGLHGSNDFFVNHTYYNFKNENSNTVYHYTSDYNGMYGWMLAKGAANNLTTGLSSQQDKVGWVSVDYFINIFSYNFGGRSLSSSSHYWFNLPQGIKITDGWISSTSRGGVTILPIIYESFSTATSLYFGTTFNTSQNTLVFDLPNTHFLHFSDDYYRLYYYDYHYFRGYTGEETSFVDIGGWNTLRYNAWPYMYLNNSSSLGTRPSVRIGTYIKSRYASTSDTGNSTNKPTIQIDNFFCGYAPYHSASNINYKFGNFIVYSQYSGNSLISIPSENYNLTYEFNGHLYGYSGVTTVLNFSYPTTFGVSSTIASSNNPSYPGGVTTSGGPQIGSSWTIPNYFLQGNIKIPLSADNWYELVGLDPIIDDSYTYNYHSLSSALPVVGANNTNYRNINATVKIKNRSYKSDNYPADTDFTFISNDFDQKPIALWTISSTSIGVYNDALISYNDNADEIIVQCSTKASNVYYSRSFMVEIPDPTLYTNINISFDISMSSSFTTSYPYARVWVVNSSTSYSSFNRVSVGNLHSYSVSLTASDLQSDVRYALMRLFVYNAGDYENKYTISNIQVNGV